MSRLLAILVLCAGSWLGAPSAVLSAEDDARGERMLLAFKKWAADNGVRDATFVATDPTGIITKGSVGRRSPDEAVSIHEMTMPLVQVCVALMVRDGELNYDDTLEQMIPGVFRAHPAASAQRKGIRVWQLYAQLSQIGGMGYEFSTNPTLKHLHSQLPYVLATPEAPGYFAEHPWPAAGNFTVLAALIQRKTGRRFEEYCSEKIFGTIGAEGGGIDPAARERRGWGSWRLPLTSFALMLDYYRNGSELNKGLRFESYSERCSRDIIYYGMIEGRSGVACGVTIGQFYIRHAFRKNYDCDPQLRLEFVQWGNDVSYVVSYFVKQCRRPQMSDYTLASPAFRAAYPGEEPPF